MTQWCDWVKSRVLSLSLSRLERLSQQCPTREAPPLAANTDFYTVTWAVRAHDTAYFAFSHSHAHTHTFTHWWRGLQPRTPTSQSRSIRASLELRINLLINLRRSISWAPAAWFFSSKAECKTVQNLCDQVRHKQKSLLFPWVVRNDSNWTIFFWNAVKKWNVQSGKERKNLTELKAVNVQLRGRILTNHMGLEGRDGDRLQLQVSFSTRSCLTLSCR